MSDGTLSSRWGAYVYCFFQVPRDHYRAQSRGPAEKQMPNVGISQIISSQHLELKPELPQPRFLGGYRYLHDSLDRVMAQLTQDACVSVLAPGSVQKRAYRLRVASKVADGGADESLVS